MRNLKQAFSFARLAGLLVLVSAAAWAQPAKPWTQCPAVSLSKSCAVLIVINVDRSVSIYTDPSVGAYDTDGDDTLVGVLNNSTSPVSALPLNGGGAPIFGFEGDGICDSTGGMVLTQAPGCGTRGYGPYGYEGPGVSFTNIPGSFSTTGCNAPWTCAVDDPSRYTSGTVNFSPAIPPAGSAYFGLEAAPAAQNITVGPTIISLSPTTLAAGGPAFALTITGGNFLAGSTVRWTTPSGQATTLTASSITGTLIQVSIPATLIASVGTATVSVVSATGIASPTSNFIISQPIFPTITISGGNGSTVNPQTSKAITITLPSAALAASTGTLSLQFAHNAVNSVPGTDATFVNGVNTFTFAAGQSTASPSTLAVQSGTVAGTITVRIATFNGFTPPSAITGTITVPRTAPVISSIKLANKTATGFDVCVSGFSSTRDITGVTYTFNSSGTGTLQTTSLTAGSDVIGKFTTWYQSASALAFNDGLFLLDQTFSVSGGSDSAIGSMTVMLQNAAGATTSISVPYSGFAATCN